MQVVIKYAKRGSDNREMIRKKTVPVKTFGTAHYNWHEAVAAAVFHAQQGERIVAIIEGGYQ